MISVEKALHIVQKEIIPCGKWERKKLADARGYALFEDVHAPIDMPPFRQSAVDGYALCLQNKSHAYSVQHEIQAGEDLCVDLKPGCAARIFTGAAVPDGATAVVMQEDVISQNGMLNVSFLPVDGLHIRPKGEQVKKGEVVLKKGNLLTPSAIGYMASLGITEVCVFTKPSIAMLVTGDELINAGQPLTHGKMYESNSTMLLSALQGHGYFCTSIHRVGDIYNDTIAKLEQTLAEHDLVLTIGGISVGDYDFVGKALSALGVKPLFYKINQKPGKPLFFGRQDKTFIFALPGNPASVLTCFYVYVYPALQSMSGHTDVGLQRAFIPSASSFTKKNSRAQFLKARIENSKVTILDGQSSSMLQTFALANALVYMPAHQDVIEEGDDVDTLHLPY